MAITMKRVVIIGAGFSGAATAIQLLRKLPRDVELVIINRSGKMAKGLAYGTNSPYHLLNVPAGNMSAIADDPGSFLRYCQAEDPLIHSGSFVSRARYGTYLEQLLANEEEKSSVRCIRIAGEVSAANPRGEGALLRLKTGEELFADHVILAAGNFPPHNPDWVANILASTAYVPDPWDTSISIAECGHVLLIGSGLTAIDTLIALQHSAPDIRVTMISRRGLVPQGHRDMLPPSKFETNIQSEISELPPSASKYLRAIREEIAKSPEHWREVITALRPATSSIWQRLEPSERRRFLRHLQPYWDTHRHRLAPESFRLFQKALEGKQVVVMPGRILRASEKSKKVEIEVRRRGSTDVEFLLFDKVFNCTGPCQNMALIQDELITCLTQNGLLSVDALSLGITVNPQYQVNSDVGNALAWLSYIGPMLKAQLWEATAVPELREHASKLASHVATIFTKVERAQD
jgi:uncharacterized NAD(P)/FAD-binding protein YdhS